MKLIATYLATATVFLVLDILWLGTVALGFYREQMGELLAQPFNLTAATAFYLLFVIGVMIFVILPAAAAGGMSQALMMGALFGFFTYMTYDLTGLAVIRNFPAKLALVDIAWGTVLTALASAAGTYVAMKFE
jgi:uncharacterized membrane protein